MVAEGINRFRAAPDHGVMLITHYTRILRYVTPDFVHVFVGGRIVEEGGPELAETLEAEGYERWVALARGGDPEAPRESGRLMTLDVARIRKDFPILDRTVRGGQPLIYLDSANTSQKPRQVIDALTEFYERHNANIHRATHELGEEATEAYEGARIKAARFIGAADETEVIFTKNISEGINLVAYSMGNASAGGSGPARFRLGPGDEIVITEMEHHSNIVPWQLLCERTGATLRWFKRDRMGRAARPVGHRRPDQRADQAGRAGSPVQRARHHQPGPGRSPTRPTRRARWCSWTRPSRSRTCRWT